MCKELAGRPSLALSMWQTGFRGLTIFVTVFKYLIPTLTSPPECRKMSKVGKVRRRGPATEHLPRTGIAMSVAELPTGNEIRLEEILTLEEAAAYLRVPEDALRKMAAEGAVPARKIGDAWRFLKRALNDWLGHDRSLGRNGGIVSADRLLDSWLEELLHLLEQRLLHKLKVEVPPKPGSKEAVMKHFGIWKDDKDIEEFLANLRAQREAT
jgi:excisionase family DNA binding protein